jgi:hypothetical protein
MLALKVLDLPLVLYSQEFLQTPQHNRSLIELKFIHRVMI